MNFMHVLEQGDVVLIAVFIVLTMMSMFSWYLIFQKLGRHRAEQGHIQSFQRAIMVSKDWPLRLTPADIKSGSLAILLKEALQHVAGLSSEDSAERREKILTAYLSQTLDNIRVELDKGLTSLASIGSSAPFIGLFGTVWGIYGALADIATAGNASLNVVAGPMGEALVATAIGLFAAIPAVLAYNAFLRKNRLILQGLRHIAEQMTLQYSDPESKALKLVRGAS
ncbi:MAG: MotA/TolQ/ExbB proton channel family protein [Alphaproteobacteria bacterium]